MKNKLLLLFVAASMLLVGCKNKSNKCKGDIGNELLDTPITDKLEFAQAGSLDGKRFASTSEDDNSYDHYGYVTLRSCTDGDTANFVQEGYVDESDKQITIKTRFLGVNTPESTAKVEPWGKKASLFTKHILEDAQANADQLTASTGKLVCNIALITDPKALGTRDSSGNRWLAFVWYRPTADAKWRNLNLELVEQCYSRNQLFIDSEMCNYRKSFEEAHARGEKCGYRVFGATDEGFDYTTKTYEYSLWGIKKHYDDIGISEEGSSGVQLIVTALVVGIQGDNLYLRDLLIDEEQYQEEGESAVLAGSYGYAGFGSSLCSTLQNASERYGGDGTGVGLVVRFFARATTYGGNIQLSDIQTGTTGKKAFRILTADNFNDYKDSFSWSHVYNTKGEVAYTDLSTSIAPVAIDQSSIDADHKSDECAYLDLLPYSGQWVTLDLTVRKVAQQEDTDPGQKALREIGYWYNPTAGSNSYTVYAQFTGKDGKKIYTNIRIDTSLSPFVNTSYWSNGVQIPNTDIDGPNSPVGHTWRVTGYFVRYFEKFQIQLGNNYAAYNYLQKLS